MGTNERKLLFKSRSWAQYGYHAAFGQLWTERIGSSKRNMLSVGPVLAKLSYTPSGVPSGMTTKHTVLLPPQLKTVRQVLEVFITPLPICLFFFKGVL